jgi:CspA family cold shock protein
MSESFSKKEKAKQKAKQKQEKAEKMKERKANHVKGKSLDEMMAYVDEDGNITSTPPTRERREIPLEEIQLGAARHEPEDTTRQGKLSFYNPSKGYGFITDEKSNESVFVHSSQLPPMAKEGDRYSFERERTPKGYAAVNVSKI